MAGEKKEVYYGQYCRTCKYRNRSEVKDPCNKCLNEPWNIDSHKPTQWKKKDD